MFTFITGNKSKLKEAQEILGEVSGYEIDLPEIQELDARKIIEAKIDEAKKQGLKSFIIEDTSLYFEALSGLPGPLIKWFLDSIGNDGLFDLIKDKSKKAKAITILGFLNKNGKVSYHEGVIEGTIVQPRGDHGFGWDSIFVPSGTNSTFAEMSPKEKNELSMRKLALIELKKCCKNNNFIVQS